MPIAPNDLEAWERLPDTLDTDDPVYRLELGGRRLLVIGDAAEEMISLSCPSGAALPTADEISLVKACFDLGHWTELGRTECAVYLTPADAADHEKALLRAAAAIAGYPMEGTD